MSATFTTIPANASQEQALDLLLEGKITKEQYREWDAARNASNKPLSCKVSEKGAVSLYGFGQWPVTLYAAQWLRVFAHREQIEAFIRDNAGKLASKPAK